MRKYAAFFLILVFGLGIFACGNANQSDPPVTEIDTMERFPLQLDMEDLHDNEKYFYFSENFDTADQELKEIHKGDLLIYDCKCLVLFYESFETTYQYTPLGRISDTAGLKETLGTGRVSISFQTENTPDTTQTSVNDISFDFETKTVTLNSGYEMMLLHHPGTGDVEAYLAMEKAVADGKIRSIGLSNWYIEELEEFLPQVNITPALVQNEIHPYYQENGVIPYIQSHGIVVQGWYPLGGRGHTAELLSDEVISEIAAAHGKSSAQVILRWNLQKGVAVIPGSSNPDHIQENTKLFDFELTEEEMERINALDRNEKHDWY